jgi:hypothetical protein
VDRCISVSSHGWRQKLELLKTTRMMRPWRAAVGARIRAGAAVEESAVARRAPLLDDLRADGFGVPAKVAT